MNNVMNQIIPILVGILITGVIALVGILIPKLFAYIKIKVGTASFQKFIGFAKFAEVNVIAYIKLHKEIKDIATEIYKQFENEIVALTGGAVTSAQIDSLFWNVANDICKELGIDIKDFEAVSLKMGVEKPLFGVKEYVKAKPLF